MEKINPTPNGFLLIDKPAGPTSHDLVDRLRRVTGIRQIGHAGTLDPFATGLLLFGIGPATKQLNQLVGLGKEYVATFILGASSDTDDVAGRITKIEGQKPTTEEIRSVIISRLLGPIEQIPPAYAAIKINGKKMYEAARAGKPIVAPPRNVCIDAFEILNGSKQNEDNTLSLPVRIQCSSGTYIRALARDLGSAFGIGGYVSVLRRTKIGPFFVEEAVVPERIKKESWTEFLLSTDTILDRLPKDKRERILN